MRNLIYTLSVLSIIFTASAIESFACSCLVSNEPLDAQIKKSFENSSVVFSGEVISIEPIDEYRQVVKFKTANAWKGAVEKEYLVNNATQSSMCGYAFTVGKKYLVYANGSGDGLTTSNCSRTQIFDSQTDIKYLDKLVLFDDPTPKKRLKNGAAVSGTLGGEAHDSYVIRVKKGQTLKVETSWKGSRDWNVEFFVSTSDNFFESDKSLRGVQSKDGKNWSMKMRKTGDYYIYVTAHPTVDYTIKTTVK